MGNAKSINENEYFVESKKALEIAKEREKAEKAKLNTADLLELTKKHKELAKTPEEYEELDNLEKELRMKIKFNQYHVPAVPPEYAEKIRRNAEVEKSEASKKLDELKVQLKTKIDYLENEVAPLVDDIRKLEQMMNIPDQINIVLDSDIGEKTVIPMSGRLQIFNPKYDGRASVRAVTEMNKLIQRLKDVQGNVTVEDKPKTKRKGDK